MSLTPSTPPADEPAPLGPQQGFALARLALREATGAAHARVDDLFSRFDLGARDGYRSFLRAQAAAHFAIEGALDRAGAAHVIPDWPERRRADALWRDLDALALDVVALSDPPSFSNAAEILGGVYVLEGSRLGGALLKRSVPDDFPTAFLTPGTPGGWRAFVTRLDAGLTAPYEIDLAIAAANAAFDTFERSARIALEEPGP